MHHPGKFSKWRESLRAGPLVRPLLYREVTKGVAMAKAGLRIVGVFGVLLLWGHFSLGGEKKAAFDQKALKAAIKTSEKDFVSQEKSKNYREDE